MFLSFRHPIHIASVLFSLLSLAYRVRQFPWAVVGQTETPIWMQQSANDNATGHLDKLISIPLPELE